MNTPFARLIKPLAEAKQSFETTSGRWDLGCLGASIVGLPPAWVPRLGRHEGIEVNQYSEKKEETTKHHERKKRERMNPVQG